MKKPKNDKDDYKESISSDDNKKVPKTVSKTDKSTFVDLKLKNLLLDSASDSIWVIDFDGNFVYVNESAYKTRGYSKKDLMNMNIHELDVPENAELIEQHLKELMETGEAKFETVHLHKDGSQIYVEIHSRIIELNEKKVVLSVIRDITSTKKYQKKLELEAKKHIEEFIKLDLKHRKREKILQKLSYLKEKLLKSIALDEKLKLITDSVVEIFDADFARIWIVKKADMCDTGCIHASITEGPHLCKYRSSCLHLVASSGRYTHIDGDHRRVPMGSYKIGRIAAGDDFKFVTNDVVHDPRVHDHEWARNLGLVSFSGFKLSSEDGKPIGVLALFKKEALDQDSEFLLGDLANTTSQLIIAENIHKDLLVSENKYRTLTESSTDSIYLLDRNLNYAYLNSQALKIVTKKPEEIIGKGLEEVFPQEVVNRMEKSVENVFKSGEPFSVEGKYFLPGGVRWLNTSLIPIKDDGQINFVLGISRDITEYKLFEIELKEREENLRLLTDNMTDVIGQIDSEGIITYTSPSLNQLSGFENQEIVGKGISDIVHHDDMEKVLDTFHNVSITKKPGYVEYRAKKSDGSYLWVESTGKAIYDTLGNFKSIVFVTRDTDERKTAEEQIKIKNRTLKGINKIFEKSLTAENESEVARSSLEVCEEITRSKFGLIFEINSKGNLDTLSISDPGWDECSMGEEKSRALLHDMKEHGLYGKVTVDGKSFFTNDPYNHEASIGTPPGHPPLTSFLGVPLEQGGKIIGSICLANKEEGYNLQDQEILEKISVAISESLMRKRAENSLKIALKDKDLLIKEIHHRVKNNLMVISSLLNLQSRYIKDKEALGLFRESQTRAKSMALIHERLYKSEDLKSINFGEYITNLAADLYRTYVTDKKRIKLNLQMKNIEYLRVDINTAVPLGLIVNELLSNSMKHAFPNDIKGQITVDFHKDDGHFELIISDNGVGFPEKLDYKNTKSLGLQIVNTLTDQIGGDIALDLENGTTFTIKFKEDFD